MRCTHILLLRSHYIKNMVVLVFLELPANLFLSNINTNDDQVCLNAFPKHKIYIMKNDLIFVFLELQSRSNLSHFPDSRYNLCFVAKKLQLQKMQWNLNLLPLMLNSKVINIEQVRYRIFCAMMP